MKKEAPDFLEKQSHEEICPPYCPFLFQERRFCRLFSVSLIAHPPMIYKCKDCLDATIRKATYKKKMKETTSRLAIWEKAFLKARNKFVRRLRSSILDLKDKKVFKDLLVALSGVFPILMDKKFLKLLVNLYMTLDGSEKEEMKSILSNPKTADVLLNKLKSCANSSPNLLKDVRREMAEIHQEEKKNTTVNENLLKEAKKRHFNTYG